MEDSCKRWVRRHSLGDGGHFIFDHDYLGGAVRPASIGYTLDIESMYAEARIR